MFQGASYASLTGANHGNTPGASPAFWGVLTAPGPQGAAGVAGPQGPVGAQGLLGPVGPPGERGDQGLQGIAGQAGAQGLTGATGAQGLSGPAGPQGVPGPVGVTYRGSYSFVTNYALADGVSYGGASYVSLVSSNHGNTPDQSPQAWGLFAAGGSVGAAGSAGPAGPVGPQGQQGQQGFTGAAGVAGVAGPVGPAGLNYLGVYSSTANYAVADAVNYGGATYVSLVAGNHGNTPGLSPDDWQAIAAQGTAGAAGKDGSPGLVYQGGYASAHTYGLNDAVSYLGGSYISLAAGNTGNTPSLAPAFWGVLSAQGAAGAVGATGASGKDGSVGVAGPAGAIGPAGPAGIAGAAGINFRGGWNGGTHYSVNDGVTFGGATYLAQSSSMNVEPDADASVWAVLAAAGGAGATGASGPAGAGATVQVGTVTTGAAGTAASVMNSGTSSAAVLNFVIPQGASGSGGGGGGSAAASTSGIPFASMYHSVSYAALYYSVNNGSQAATETAAVLSWSPGGCSATTLTVFSEQSGTIAVTLRAGATPATMANTSLSCTVGQGQSCTANGLATVPVGGFVDLMVTQADGTPSPVWSAVSCN
ncbi:collagen-like protein [Granulicella tundricola]|uniref:Collagen triple helix repeat-containing protein n=1 Tax=Granulicella tundricola (strain ATCC BAA-1859 / DSM 23138 / MP5ACTX9) TaxID=1198114 RepID=E8X2X5_GRATM|nr:collagen-like protein [Granulicella tundricola]ADW68109.1 Collagen triple helix repeat-containing protein [Granulicella tundricola MP5ACTX9]